MMVLEVQNQSDGANVKVLAGLFCLLALREETISLTFSALKATCVSQLVASSSALELIQALLYRTYWLSHKG